MPDVLPIIIIGTGLAGYSLAREFRKLDQNTPLLMLSRDDAHSYSKPMLSTGFTKKKDANALSMADPGKMAAQLKVSIRNFTDVTHIEADQNQIRIGDETLGYSKLVLASGAKVNTLDFPGSDHPDVISINDLMDYRAFRQKLTTGKKNILIMGAGLIGCEYANDLLNDGYQVTIVDPSESALNGLIPDFAGKALIQGLEEAGAEFHMQDYVSEVHGQKDGLHVRLNNGRELKCDLIISAVGLKPDIGLAREAGIHCNRGITTNAYLQTNQDNIYALGDCAEVEGRVRLYVLPLMASARALAKTLHGQKTEVIFGIMPVATKTPACPVITCPPITTPDKTIAGEWKIEQDGINIMAKFVDTHQHLRGFVLTGDKIKAKQNLLKELAPQP